MKEFDSSIFNNGIFGIDVSKHIEESSADVKSASIRSPEVVLQTKQVKSAAVSRTVNRQSEREKRSVDFTFEQGKDFDLSK